MGCGSSRQASASTNRTANGPTRPRADTWDKEPSNMATTSSQRPVVNPAKEQWKELFYSHRKQLLDPVDVIGGLEDLSSKIIDKNLPNIVFLQRRLRSTVRDLPQTEKNLSRVFGNTKTEARLILEKHHLLTRPVLEAILPNSSVQGNIITLMLFLNDNLWERVAAQAVRTAEENKLEMDVNKHVNENDEPEPELPKPSLLMNIDEMVDEVPLGTSLMNVATILALAYGSRKQKLHLLFYSLIDPLELETFLKTHPAGGVPTWLLEVDNHTIVSLPSLAHYHYYGTAPIGKVDDFVASQSRRPLTIDAAVFRDVVMQEATARRPSYHNHKATSDSGDSGNNNNNNNSNHDDSNKDDSNSDSKHNNNHNAPTIVMQCLNDVSEGRRADSLTVDLFVPELTGLWNIQEFFEFCDNNINDTTLDVVMHKLFGRGIFPSPSLERELVLQKWVEYYEEQEEFAKNGNASMTELISNSVSSLLFGNPTSKLARLKSVWGGLGNIDGKGGLGYGVLYCVPSPWWNHWVAYSGWTFLKGQRKKRKGRPLSLQTESLLEHDPDVVIRGVDGSYEVMKKNLKVGRDYVMVPPGVWDVLYEIYTGGPPLPRMVKPYGGDPLSASEIFMRSSVSSGDPNNDIGVPRLPDYIRVETHPWILHIHLCDPLQPYRRSGEVGSISIRVMVSPDQPLWRVFGEIVCRFNLKTPKAFDADGEGKARLWKRIDSNGQAPPRYGPWNLLCKNRHGIVPLFDDLEEIGDVISDWEAYADKQTVKSAGLVDHDSLMFEFAIQNKMGELTWPREAAAKAGKVRRLAEEDRKFRQILEGVDEEGKPLEKAPSLVGMDVDAEDSAGRWFTVKILDTQIVEETDSEEEELADEDPPMIARKKVKVSFKEHGGHTTWIEVSSDKLQAAGRFATEASGEAQLHSNGTNGNGETRSKSGAGSKRSNSSATENGADNTKLCPLPGFGSCGLPNLGNTCYMNSAVQCMAYLPLLRAYLVSSQYKRTGDLNKDNPLGTGGKLLEEFAELLRALWSSRFAEKSPIRFRQILGKTNMQFSGADQQDAQEFLNYIYDVLREDSNKVRKKPYVESLEDAWIAKHSLVRVGEESWRRFLRRDRSIMTDIAMGQVLNTVTCPICHYSSRKFDEFNLLSVPIPTFADVVFRCTVFRRASAKNCGWVLNKPRKNDAKASRYHSKLLDAPSGPPSEGLIAEQYVVALSRLADSGDLRLHLQNLTGIRANHLRLCRNDEVVAAEDAESDSPLTKYFRITPLSEKDGPVSQHVKKSATEDGATKATPIIAFEYTLNTRQLEEENKELEDAKSTDEEQTDNDPMYINKDEVMRHIRAYGDEKECRLVDTDPLLIAKAVSRSLWPRSDKELRVGLRVDAKDTQGKWFPGSIVEISEVGVTRADSDTGEEITVPLKKVRIHFDNYMPKWDEVYSIESFKKGRVLPLYSHATPKPRPTEFIVRHRYADRSSKRNITFGQPFYVHCKNEWSNARAGAHILAQASRFLRTSSGKDDFFDRVQTAVSELIDFLIDCDREFIQLALGLSKHNSEEEKAHPFRNPTFESKKLLVVATKKIAGMLQRLPFEIIVGSMDTNQPDKERNQSTEEMFFPFALNTTICNFVSVRNVIFLQWRDVGERKTDARRQRSLIPYSPPRVHVHESSAEVLNSVQEQLNNGKKDKLADSVDLAYCLSEFCKVQKLPMSDNWKCPRCKVIREGGQNLSVWRLPDLLTFHIKRFNMSARWHEKILTKVHFPMTGLDMSEWCHKESPVRGDPQDSYVYDLIGVMNHYGSMTGGHYVATCKATLCTKEGKEEVSYAFNGPGADSFESEEIGEPSGWGLRSKPKVSQSRIDAALSSRSVAESSEPMWLQFDDEVVEPIPPRHVVSEMAYVLFYRRRRISPSNIAKYCTLE